jgi:hypothetical protein
MTCRSRGPTPQQPAPHYFAPITPSVRGPAKGAGSRLNGRYQTVQLFKVGKNDYNGTTKPVEPLVNKLCQKGELFEGNENEVKYWLKQFASDNRYGDFESLEHLKEILSHFIFTEKRISNEEADMNSRAENHSSCTEL